MDLDFDYSGTTKLKNWWRQVKSNFQTIEDEVNEHEETTATDEVEGHVKLYDTVSSLYNADDGLAATPYAVSTRAPANHRSSASTYGMGTNSYYGHVKLSDATDGTNTQTGGVAATPAAVKAAYDLATEANTEAEKTSGKFTLYATCDSAASSTTKTLIWPYSDIPSISTGTQIAVRFTYANTTTSSLYLSIPTGEDGDETTYQVYTIHVGSGTNVLWNAGDVVEFVFDGSYMRLIRPRNATGTYFGDVRLSDAIASTSSVTGGYAATPYAVKQAYDLAKSAVSASGISEEELYYPEYHADDVDSTTNFYLDCADVDGDGTALFKVTIRDVSSWADLKSGKGFAITDDNIADDGIISTDGALTATLSSYAGFNSSSSFTILFDASIPQQSSNDDATVLFQLGSNRVLQIHQKGQDGIRLVTYDADSTAHVYPEKLENGSDLDGGTYTTGHYVVPLNATFDAQGYGSYHHFAVVFDTDNETVTWYQGGSVYSTSDMEDTYVKVDGGYTATILENAGSGLRYFKIVRKAMTQAEISAYNAAHPDSNYTSQPKTQYDNKLLELEESVEEATAAATSMAKYYDAPMEVAEWIDGTSVWRVGFNVTLTADNISDLQLPDIIDVADTDSVFVIGGYARLRYGAEPCLIDDYAIGTPNACAPCAFHLGDVPSNVISGLTAGTSGAYGWVEFVTDLDNLNN